MQSWRVADLAQRQQSIPTKLPDGIFFGEPAWSKLPFFPEADANLVTPRSRTSKRRPFSPPRISTSNTARCAVGRGEMTAARHSWPTWWGFPSHLGRQDHSPGAAARARSEHRRDRNGRANVGNTQIPHGGPTYTAPPFMYGIGGCACGQS